MKRVRYEIRWVGDRSGFIAKLDGGVDALCVAAEIARQLPEGFGAPVDLSVKNSIRIPRTVLTHRIQDAERVLQSAIEQCLNDKIVGVVEVL